MTQKQQDKIKRLLRLADVAQDFEYVDLPLTDQWCELREESGLAKLLLSIEKHVREQTNKNHAKTQTFKTEHTNQDATLVQ